MYNIRQVYLDHVGFKGAWFQDVHLPFFNSETQVEQGTKDTILSLTNGGGKTTLLSLIFTCFVPDKRLFVQHLQKAHHHFNDYFTEKPGLILIELEHASDQLQIDGEPRFNKTIIGQYISIDPSTNEDDRQFFAFKPTKTLGFNDVPSLGKGEVTKKEEIRKWLKTAAEEEESFFRPYNNSHAEWMKWLDNEGIDTWIIRKQVEFCRAEGGIDAYMNFHSELDFLKEFFYMVMPPGNADQNRDILSKALIKLRKRPEYERKKQLLQGLKNRLTPFAVEASLMVFKEKELETNQRNAATLYQAMSGRVEELTSQTKVQKDLIREHVQQRSDLERKLKKEELELELTKDFIFQINLEERQEHLKKEEVRRDQNAKLEKEARAALVLKQKRDLENSVRSYQDAIQNASLDLEPIKDLKDQATLKFHAKLKDLRKKRVMELEKFQSTETELQIELSENKEKSNVIVKDQSRFSVRLGQIEKSLDQHEARSKKLIDEEVLESGQKVTDALTKLETSIVSAEEGLQREKEKIQICHEEVRLCSENLEQAIREKSDLTNEVIRIDERIAKARDTGELFIKEPLIFQIFGDESVDPAEKDVELRLQSYLSRKETEEQGALISRQLIKEEIQLLEETQSRLLDSNTHLALKFLRENGVDNAFFYPDLFTREYKMEPELVRQWVEQDIGRFLGIGIPETEDLKEIEKLNSSMDFLRYPIRITKLSSKENFLESPQAKKPESDYLVLAPPGSEVYQKSGVEGRLKELTTMEQEKDKELFALKDLKNKAHRLIQKQQDYSLEFGDNKLAVLIQTKEFAEENIQAKDLKTRNLRDQKEISNQKISEGDQELEKVKSTLENLRLKQQRLTDFHTNYDQEHVGNQETRIHLRKKLESLDRDRIKVSQASQEVESKKETLLVDLIHLKTEIDVYNQRALNLNLGDSTQGADDFDLSVSEESLEQDYLIKTKAYDNALNKSGLDGLNASLEEVRKQKIQAEKDYSRILADNDLENVKKLALEEKKTLIKMGDTAREDADKALQASGVIKGELNSLEQEHELFRSRRRYPEALRDRPELNLVQLTELENSVDEKILACRSNLQELADQIYEKERSLNKLSEDLRKIEMLRKFLQEYSETSESPNQEADVAPLNLDELEDKIEECRQQILANSSAFEQARNKARNSFEQVCRFVQSEEFREEENRLSYEIGNNPFDNVCLHVEEHLRLTDQRIETLIHEIAGTEEDLEICVGHLQNHVAEALKKLRFVMRNAHIPKEVPNMGGKKILKMKTDLSSVNKEQKAIHLKAYVEELAETQLVPNVGNETGDELTAALIVAIAKGKNRTGKLGIEIIKLSKLVEYTPISEIKGSGGESMTSALLLYLTIAQLRAESRAGAKNAIGGFLLMDNPFSRATTPQLIKSQVELAKKLGFQLIYATAIKDFNAQSLFSHFVQLRQVAYDRTHDRVHVNKVESAEFTTLREIS